MPSSAHDRLPPGSHRHCLHCVERPKAKEEEEDEAEDEGKEAAVVCSIAFNLTNDRCNVCGLCQCLSCGLHFCRQVSVALFVHLLQPKKKTKERGATKDSFDRRSGFTSLAENV